MIHKLAITCIFLIHIPLMGAAISVALPRKITRTEYVGGTSGPIIEYETESIENKISIIARFFTRTNKYELITSRQTMSGRTHVDRKTDIREAQKHYITLAFEWEKQEKLAATTIKASTPTETKKQTSE